jgi:hypothetical protein
MLLDLRLQEKGFEAQMLARWKWYRGGDGEGPFLLSSPYHVGMSKITELSRISVKTNLKLNEKNKFRNQNLHQQWALSERVVAEYDGEMH